MPREPLGAKHKEAAKLLANGEKHRVVMERVGISESGLLRWKRRVDFQQLIEEYKPESTPLEDIIQAYSTELLEQARDDEILLAVELKELLERICRLISKRLDAMTDQEIEELPIRLLPTLINSFQDGLGSLQNAHDRITGYGLLVKELGSIIEGSRTAASPD